jgi:hypothetical protein
MELRLGASVEFAGATKSFIRSTSHIHCNAKRGTGRLCRRTSEEGRRWRLDETKA